MRYRRCPTGREDREVRVFTIEGCTRGERDLALQLYRRVGHDLTAPWGPASAAVRVPLRFADRLAELIAQAAAEATTAETTAETTEAG